MSYLYLSIGSLVIALAATHIRGLTINNYLLYAIAQLVAIPLLLLANKDMNPLSYAVGVNGFVGLFAIVIVLVEGVAFSHYTIIGMILILLGTYLTFQ
ncbi:hypothetical protein LCGC14_2041790 [marine sediment metagenome]|uniref:Uncharacterized protein n=1 Tax=marine sediment metagenome TaxID=412755 RepID=A0A0F9ERU8_9ZZZZ